MLGMGNSTSLSVPDELAAAVRAEAARRVCRPADVLLDFLRRCWPEYVAGQLRADFGSHPAPENPESLGDA
jgi:hypothetical protein